MDVIAADPNGGRIVELATALMSALIERAQAA
jgi:hypothetical protein